jgi:selenocysteine-specific elongation factor
MPAPSLVLGTAGHIDHGKSSLVKALTGTDPDRLPEEKERGVTIELGFARLDLLGIPKGVVAITKADLADDDWIALVTDDVARLLAGTSIEGAPIVAVSSRSRRGLDELLATLDTVAGEAQARQAALPMRLPVDRVFTVAGAGTVVTGTMWSGTARRDDQVEVLPSGRTGRVRGLQVHSSAVAEAVAGQRVAMNIAGLDKDEVARGDIVAAPGTLSVTDRFDARFAYLSSNERPFVSGARVHIHHGTREVLGRVLLLDGREELAPGDGAFAQVRLEEPLAPRYDDRFIVRSYSPVFTIGGGVVLDTLPARRTTLRDAERGLLESLLAHELSAAALDLLASRGIPMTSAEVAAALGIPRAGVADDLNRADLERVKVGQDTCYVTHAGLDRLVGGIEAALVAFHAEHPKSTGIAAGALRDLVDRRVPLKVFDALVEAACARGLARASGGHVSHPAAAATALAEEEAALARLVPVLEAQGLSTGTVAELAGEAGVDAGVARKALGRLVSEGRVVRLGPELHFASSAVAHARDAIVAFLDEHGTMLAKDARDVTGSSRKYIVPLLEYLDAQGVTKRDGDARTLRGS